MGQESGNSPIVNFLIKRKYQFPDSVKKGIVVDSFPQWPDTIYYNTMYTAARLGCATIPISFSNIELARGNAEVSPTVGVGFGYSWFHGKFLFNENDKITIDPTFFYGFIANAGLENNLSFNQLASFTMGAFIGVVNFTLFGGYDFINRSPTIGLGGRIDFYTISQKYLNVYGRVREVRKRKKIALPVTLD